MQKNAQFGSLQTIVITLVIVGLVLGIGFLILQEFQKNQGSIAGSVTNETMTPLLAGQYVAHNGTADNCYNSFAVVKVTNGTGTYLTSGNYTYEQATGKIVSTYALYTTGARWNVSYTYNYGTGESCSAIASTVDAVKKVPTWLAIIVILLIVGILLGIVFKVLPSGGGEYSYHGGSSSGGMTAEI